MVATSSANYGSVTGPAHLVSLHDAYYQDPMGFFAQPRESSPVAPVWMLDFGRVWVITHYADVRAALADPRLVNKVRRRPDGSRSLPDEAAGVHALLSTDPPDHARLRRLLQKAFTPRRAARLRPRTEEIAAGLLDELAAGGDVTDLLGGYARPLPVTVICELPGPPCPGRR
jgi:cytochrome P450